MGWINNYGLPCENFCSAHLIDHSEGISWLCFSDSSELLVSYMNEYIYLFPKDEGQILCPCFLIVIRKINEDKSNSVLSISNSSLVIKAYKGHYNRKTVKDVNFFGPYCDYMVSGSDCGRISIWRKKDGVLLRAMKGDRNVVNCTVSHPHTTMLASTGIENNVKIWVPNTTQPCHLVNLDEGYNGEDLENDDDSCDTNFSDSGDDTEEDVFADGTSF